MDIILASTSPYRRRLLERLQIPFRCLPPDVDERRLAGESPAAMASRLALAKARAVALHYPDALVIGSDQVAALEATDAGGAATAAIVLGKPGSHMAARAQLKASAGRVVCFYTGVAVCVAASGFERFHVEPFRAYFRELDDKSIENYLSREQPYDCAGSFKWEGLGIALFERLEGRDPTSLEGLPLIALTDLLAAAGYPVLADTAP
jgi:MAF protein